MGAASSFGRRLAAILVDALLLAGGVLVIVVHGAEALAPPGHAPFLPLWARPRPSGSSPRSWASLSRLVGADGEETYR